jgi:hypothetical protein
MYSNINPQNIAPEPIDPLLNNNINFLYTLINSIFIRYESTTLLDAFDIFGDEPDNHMKIYHRHRNALDNFIKKYDIKNIKNIFNYLKKYNDTLYNTYNKYYTKLLFYTKIYGIDRHIEKIEQQAARHTQRHNKNKRGIHNKWDTFGKMSLLTQREQFKEKPVSHRFGGTRHPRKNRKSKQTHKHKNRPRKTRKHRST